MLEIDDWNGHRVLALPGDHHTLLTVLRLIGELGLGGPGRHTCALCPAWDATKPEGRRCTNPSRHQPSTQGGCAGCFVVAEEYIPLVQIRLEEQP